ncbi:DUF3857 domain-containing protein [Myroides sp. WP-1]|uniref:DUF3857 domain-containing protein n=1 Tax=Myroides sp. WP-1 TaxID=2759944 RepID=UPI0015FAFDF6|nr:DUF3857 domain-containing protein [Myroides sp. WP-1]MBB1138438.1 DUF3857 domain-containing protein [Myroides sp. WP-1]
MNKIVFVVLGIFSLSTYAQDAPNQRLSNVQREEPQEVLQLNKADAVVLNEEGIIEYQFSEEEGFSILLKVKRLIQINSKEGISHASLLVPFYSNRYTREEVEVESYEIHRTANGKEEVIAVNTASNRLIDDGFYLKEIIVNDIRIGDVIAYSYVKKIDNIDVIPTWYFQEDIPKLKSSYTVRIPDNLTYLITNTGGIKVKETKEVTETTRDLTKNKWGTSYRFKEAILKFEAKEVPAFVYEPFMDNIKNAKSGIRFDLIQFQYPMSPSVVVPHEPVAVAKELNKDRNFGGELRQEKYWNKLIAELNLDGLNQQEKAEQIVSFIHSKIKWNQQYGYWTEQGVKKAMAQGKGNSGDINIALIGALRAAGFVAEPIVLSTQSNGKAPILFARFLNQVIVGLQIDNQFFVVDGTMDQPILNVLPFEDLNEDGWMITEQNEVSKVDLIPKQFSFKQEEFAVNLKEDGNAEGSMKSTRTRYEAAAFRARYGESMLNRSRSDIEARSNQFFLSQGEIKPLKNGDIEMQYQVRKFNFATKNPQSGELTFNPMELYAEKQNPFNERTRQSDIHLLYPSMDMYKIVVQLPEGYQVKNYPTDEVFTSEKTGAKLIYEVKLLDGNKIQVGMSLRLQKTVIAKEDYLEFRQLYKIVQQRINEMHIVIEKVK